MNAKTKLRQTLQQSRKTSPNILEASPRLIGRLVVMVSLLCAAHSVSLASEPFPPDVVMGPYAAANFPAAAPFHGCGGDRVLLFAVQVSGASGSEAGIHVALRATATPAGRVTPPPVGWKVPLSLELYDFSENGQSTQGSFVMLDAGA